MTQATVYFDTNLFGMMADRGDSQQVSDYLRRNAMVARASHQTLAEIMAINNFERRAAELSLLRSIARPMEGLPLAFRQATELRHAIRRHHPEWLKSNPNVTQIKRFLRAHKAHWRMSLTGQGMPEAARTTYREVSRRGIDGARNAQRHWRKTRQEGSAVLTTASGSTWDLGETSKGWRADCLMCWHAALYERLEESRDYDDYLRPYLRPDLPRDPEFAHFWMEEVEESELPLNRLTGLAAYIQLEKKPGQGNAGDVLHAAFLGEVDYFITADRDFAFVLKKVAQMTPSAAQILLIDRARESTVLALSDAFART